MHSSYYPLFTVITVLSIFLPSMALAQAHPRIMLEKSASYELDNKVRAFRVPVTNSAGVVKYFDITVTLDVSPMGVVSPTAEVTVTRSIEPTTGVIAPGTYKATDGTLCKVTNLALTNGRIQSFFACLDNGVVSDPHELSLASGRISAGHPFLTELTAAEINTHPDVGTYTWGLSGNGYFDVGTCGYYPNGYPVGAKTNGNLLILSIFHYGAPGNLQCSATFTKQP